MPQSFPAAAHPQGTGATPSPAPAATGKAAGPDSATAATKPASMPFLLKAKALWDGSRPQRILVGKAVLLVAAITIVTALAATVPVGLVLSGGSMLMVVVCFAGLYGACIWAGGHVFTEIMAAWRAAMANKAAQAASNQPNV